jgi:hypothetical protein
VTIAHQVLTRAIRHAEANDLVRRNVASLIRTPKGATMGRRSRALDLGQAAALLEAARHRVADLPGPLQGAGEGLSHDVVGHGTAACREGVDRPPQARGSVPEHLLVVGCHTWRRLLWLLAAQLQLR